MNKLKLDLDNLAVESFESSNAAGAEDGLKSLGVSIDRSCVDTNCKFSVCVSSPCYC
jgi:hypothetical protein